MRQKLQKEQKEKKLRNLNAQTLKIILIYHKTFDVNSHHLRDFLEQEKNIIVMIKCLIIIYDQCFVIIEDQSTLISLLLHRY